MGMTNEEREKHIRIANMLIGVINDVNTPMLMYQIEKDVAKEALKNYIKMLEQQPSEDCISREEVRQAIGYVVYEYGIKSQDFANALLERVNDLPSVTPTRPIEQQPKIGHWIYTPKRRLDDETDEGRVYITDYRCTCSECGGGFRISENERCLL